ncbi:LmeA family phospholipid-binding protein [Georgenia sp. Z1491]|uniref:LmeA family phospholipid-binding protein n=1 Tax=Georgenia sp. Z1491 TaxID=3416707 RepID=UPI003CEC1CD7
MLPGTSDDDMDRSPDPVADPTGPPGTDAADAAHPESDPDAAHPEPDPDVLPEPVPDVVAEAGTDQGSEPPTASTAPRASEPASEVPELPEHGEVEAPGSATSAHERDTAELDGAGGTAVVPVVEGGAPLASDAAAGSDAGPGAQDAGAVADPSPHDDPDHARAEHSDRDPGTPAALAAVQGAAQAVRGWWRRAGSGVVQRWVLSLVIASLVLVVGLLVADRWALMRARAEADDAIVSFTQEVENPDVRLDGFPFLPQVVSGRIDRIDFTADRMVLPDVELMDVRGWMTGVGFRAPIEVARLEASGTVPLELVQEQVAEATFDVPVLGERSFEADIEGNELVLTTSILGGDIHVTADVAPTDDGRGIHLHLDRGTLGGVSTELSSIPLVGSRLPLDHYVPLEGLPEGLVLTSTTVVGDGIAVGVEGDDVRF